MYLSGSQLRKYMQQHDQTIFRQTEAQLLLRGVSGVTFGKTFKLVGSMVIGREKECDITIPNDEISRQHARIIARPGSIMIEDMGSSNGTYVNNQPVQKAVVKEGDEIRFDKIRFKVLSLSEADEFLTEPNRATPEMSASAAIPEKSKSSVGKVNFSILFIAIAATAAAYFIN